MQCRPHVVKFAARRRIIDVCLVPSQYATVQTTALSPLRKKRRAGRLDHSFRFVYRVHKQLKLATISLPSGTKETKKPRQDSHPRTAVGFHLHKKRKCLDLSQKFAVLEYAKKHPNLGSRKIADQFGTGKTQIQAILRNKESIVTLYESNICRNQVKRSRTAKYSDVNEAVWDWYTLCRKSNIPVSGAMLQEEAMIIAEKLEMNDFVASNGWLDRFKRQHNICNMAVAGEAGDVSTETVESWNERAREITRGWKAENIWNMDETGSFWRGLPEKTLSEKGRLALVVNRPNKGLRGHSLQTQQEKKRIQ